MIHRLFFNCLRWINGNIRISFLQRTFRCYRKRTDNGCLMTIRTNDLQSLFSMKRLAPPCRNKNYIVFIEIFNKMLCTKGRGYSIKQKKGLLMSQEAGTSGNTKIFVFFSETSFSCLSNWLCLTFWKLNPGSTVSYSMSVQSDVSVEPIKIDCAYVSFCYKIQLEPAGTHNQFVL